MSETNFPKSNLASRFLNAILIHFPCFLRHKLTVLMEQLSISILYLRSECQESRISINSNIGVGKGKELFHSLAVAVPEARKTKSSIRICVSICGETLTHMKQSCYSAENQIFFFSHRKF